MTVGTLPWNEIMLEVNLATRSFFIAVHGGEKTFVNVPRLVDWLDANPEPFLYPNITGLNWDVIECRVTKGMQRMGWKRYARNVFVVPGVDVEVVESGAEA